MPCYPAFALLIGSGLAMNGKILRVGTRLLTVICSTAAVAAITILFAVRHVPTPADISKALSSNPAAYTLSLGHVLDLTLDSFAYLRFPLYLAGAAFLIGALANLLWKGSRAYLLTCLMMIMFFLAARQALTVFDPYLSSRPLAEALLAQPPGKLIVQGHYYTFSSVPFYANTSPLLLNGKKQNLDYGAAAPGAPAVFLTDTDFATLWTSPDRYYFVGSQREVQRIENLVGAEHFATVLSSGGKLLLRNVPTGQ